MAIGRALPGLSAAGFGGGGIPHLLQLRKERFSSTVSKKALGETARLQRIIITTYIFCSNKPISSIKPNPSGHDTYPRASLPLTVLTGSCDLAMSNCSWPPLSPYEGCFKWRKKLTQSSAFFVRNTASVRGVAGGSNDAVLNLHTDLFCFASSISPAHSQGENYSENSSSTAPVRLLNNCKTFSGILGYFNSDAEGSHGPYLITTHVSGTEPRSQLSPWFLGTWQGRLCYFYSIIWGVTEAFHLALGRWANAVSNMGPRYRHPPCKCRRI